MRTLLSQFCEEFETTVRPVLDPLSRSAKTLSAATPALSARAVLPHLLDLRHQLQSLADKVAQQQAYVLIFGPLKSGKSTLMNAMSAAYVSEVTCLPAYPCMVYVSHSPTRRYEIESYNGDKKGFSNPEAMRDEVVRAHGELAQRIRERERSGGDFDPAIHWPQAIRRVSVQVPAKALEKSGAVLVDTPGLYSRMKFGYDRMTREFRNAAASAIFVVKTDNLFLEQVFEEFNQLLQLFSRIFLVVNVDSTKQDLRPDGTLAPSLEGNEPGRVVEAFQDLSMSAPLQKAMDEGRLSIYPVDLLRAASQRVSGKAGSEAAGFERFLGDLTDYLNSTDYLVAFLGDSLRRARSLANEIADVCTHDSVKRLTKEVQDLRGERALALSQAEVLGRLESHGWQEAFDTLRSELGDKSREPVDRVRARLEDDMDAAIDEWFASDADLQSLVVRKAGALLDAGQRDLGESVRSALQDRVRLGSAGLVLSERTLRDLDAGGIPLDRVGRDAMENLAVQTRPHDARPSVATSEIPVKKGFWDWILFRTQASVRKRLFGPPQSPTKRIPAAQKEKRLGREGREALRQRLDQYLDTTFDADADHVSRQVFGDYAQAVTGRVMEEVSSRKAKNAERLDTLGRRLEEVERILGEIKDLAAAAEGVSTGVAELQARYGETEPEKLIQPVKAVVKKEEAPKGNAAPQAKPEAHSAKAAPSNSPAPAPPKANSE